MGRKSNFSKKASENPKFPAFSEVKTIISKEEYMIYREMNINPVRVFKFLHRQVFNKIFHAAQCYGELCNLHSDDIALAIIEAADFAEFEKNQAIKKMKEVEKRKMDKRVKRGTEIVKGETEEDKYREVGILYKDDDEVVKAEWKG